jgi:hypothetical protein
MLLTPADDSSSHAQWNQPRQRKGLPRNVARGSSSTTSLVLSNQWSPSPGIRVLGIEPKKEKTKLSVSTNQPPRPVQCALSLRLISLTRRSISDATLLRFPEHRPYVSEFFVADVTPEPHFFEVLG